MNDKAFFDTNVLVYAHTDIDIKKRQAAQDLISGKKYTVISTQVLQEISNTLFRKFKHSWPDVSSVIQQLIAYNRIHSNTAETIARAIDIAARYGFSFYDSLIVASALETGCSILYSEDMQHEQKIDNILTILNPFA